jgi:hypothetical protein
MPYRFYIIESARGIEVLANQGTVDQNQRRQEKYAERVAEKGGNIREVVDVDMVYRRTDKQPKRDQMLRSKKGDVRDGFLGRLPEVERLRLQRLAEAPPPPRTPREGSLLPAVSPRKEQLPRKRAAVGNPQVSTGQQAEGGGLENFSLGPPLQSDMGGRGMKAGLPPLNGLLSPHPVGQLRAAPIPDLNGGALEDEVLGPVGLGGRLDDATAGAMAAHLLLENHEHAERDTFSAPVGFHQQGGGATLSQPYMQWEDTGALAVPSQEERRGAVAERGALDIPIANLQQKRATDPAARAPVANYQQNRVGDPAAAHTLGVVTQPRAQGMVPPPVGEFHRLPPPIPHGDAHPGMMLPGQNVYYQSKKKRSKTRKREVHDGGATSRTAPITYLLKLKRSVMDRSQWELLPPEPVLKGTDDGARPSTSGVGGPSASAKSAMPGPSTSANLEMARPSTSAKSENTSAPLLPGGGLWEQQPRVKKVRSKGKKKKRTLDPETGLFMKRPSSKRKRTPREYLEGEPRRKVGRPPGPRSASPGERGMSVGVLALGAAEGPDAGYEDSEQEEYEDLEGPCSALLVIKEGAEGEAVLVEEREENGGWQLGVLRGGNVVKAFVPERFGPEGKVVPASGAVVWTASEKSDGSQWSLVFFARLDWLRFRDLHDQVLVKVRKAARSRKIPIPGVVEVEDYETNYPLGSFSLSEGVYIKYGEDDGSLARHADTVLYDLDSEDEAWLAEVNRRSADGGVHPGMSESQLERAGTLAIAMPQQAVKLEPLSGAVLQGPGEGVAAEKSGQQPEAEAIARVEGGGGGMQVGGAANEGEKHPSNRVGASAEPGNTGPSTGQENAVRDEGLVERAEGTGALRQVDGGAEEPRAEGEEEKRQETAAQGVGGLTGLLVIEGMGSLQVENVSLETPPASEGESAGALSMELEGPVTGMSADEKAVAEALSPAEQGLVEEEPGLEGPVEGQGGGVEAAAEGQTPAQQGLVEGQGGGKSAPAEGQAPAIQGPVEVKGPVDGQAGGELAPAEGHAPVKQGPVEEDPKVEGLVEGQAGGQSAPAEGQAPTKQGPVEEDWVALSLQPCSQAIDPDTLERIIDKLEKVSAQAGNVVSKEEGCKACEGLAPGDVVRAVYAHWRVRRQKRGMAVIRYFQVGDTAEPVLSRLTFNRQVINFWWVSRWATICSVHEPFEIAGVKHADSLACTNGDTEGGNCSEGRAVALASEICLRYRLKFADLPSQPQFQLRE